MTWYSREEWGANPAEPGGFHIVGPLAEFYIHHWNSGIAPENTVAGAIARVCRTQGDHIGNGWGDVGYSWLVDDLGNVYEGRGWNRTGAHTYGFNSKGYAACWLGDSTNDVPTPAALGAIVEVILAGIRDGHLIAAPTIVAHRDRVATACCGDQLYNLLPTIRSAVTNGPTPPEDDMLPEQIDQLAAIVKALYPEGDTTKTPHPEHIIELVEDAFYPRGGVPAKEASVLNTLGAIRGKFTSEMTLWAARQELERMALEPRGGPAARADVGQVVERGEAALDTLDQAQFAALLGRIVIEIDRRLTVPAGVRPTVGS